MRLALLFGFIILSKITLSQVIPKFELTKNGVQPIFITIDSLNARKLNKKTVNWINDYYKNPDEVNKIELESDRIHINGLKKNAWMYKSKDTTIHYDVEYFLHLNFEDNAISMSIDFGKTWDQSSGKGIQSYDLNYTKLWKQNGDVYPVYKDTKAGMDAMMNELATSLVSHLKEDHNSTEEITSKHPLHKLWLKLKVKDAN